MTYLVIATASFRLFALVDKTLATPSTLSPQKAEVLVHGPTQRTRQRTSTRMQAYSRERRGGE